MIATCSKNNHAHSASDIKITTINLYNYIAPPSAYYYFDNIYTQSQWEEKNNWIKHYITKEQPDIIGFQEVFSTDELSTMVESLGYPYFAVVDSATLEESYIYSSPVVALASRFPIKHVSPVAPDPDVSTHLGINQAFEFRRKPLFATLAIPKFGDVNIYVIHLKSKRPIDPINNNKQTLSLSQNIQNELVGTLASQIQRSTEACQLFSNIVKQRAISNLPTIIMGDFNDNLSAETLHAFHLNRLRPFTPDMVEHPLSHFQFHDSWDLYLKTSLNTNNDEKKPFTYYFHHAGSIIDNILLSSEFDSAEPNNLIQVIDYHCEDSHISPHHCHQFVGTDHAIVSITLLIRN